MHSLELTELIIIGTMHSRHNTAKFYTPEALRQILFALRPHRFCLESEPQYIGDDGYIIPMADVEAARVRMPEGVILDEVSRHSQIKVLPFDREGLSAGYRETRYFERRESACAKYQELIYTLTSTNPMCVECKIAELLGHAEQSQFLLDQNAGPEIVNSAACDNLIRIKHSIPVTILPLLTKHEGYEEMIADWKFIFDEWEERNTIMADNLMRICNEFPGKRLVVLTGYEHRYALQDRLANQPGIILKEFWEV